MCMFACACVRACVCDYESSSTSLDRLEVGMNELMTRYCVLYALPEQASGYGGTVSKAKASEKVENMQAVRERELTIRCA